MKTFVSGVAAAWIRGATAGRHRPAATPVRRLLCEWDNSAWTQLPFSLSIMPPTLSSGALLPQACGSSPSVIHNFSQANRNGSSGRWLRRLISSSNIPGPRNLDTTQRLNVSQAWRENSDKFQTSVTFPLSPSSLLASSVSFVLLAGVATMITDDASSSTNHHLSIGSSASPCLAEAAPQSSSVVPPHPTVSPLSSSNTPQMLQRRLTAIGKLSILSETAHHPSIVTMVMEIDNGRSSSEQPTASTSSSPPSSPLTARDIQKLWQDKVVAKHPRFAAQGVGPGPAPAYHHFVHEEDSPDESDQVDRNDSPISNQAGRLDRVIDTAYPHSRRELAAWVERIQSTRWPLEDSLWQIFVANPPDRHTPTSIATQSLETSRMITENATSNNNNNSSSSTIIMFRGHHVLADGASIGVVLGDLSDESEQIQSSILEGLEAFRQKKREANHRDRLLLRWWQRWAKYLNMLFCIVCGILLAVMYQLKLYVLLWWTGPDAWSIVRSRVIQRLRPSESNEIHAEEDEDTDADMLFSERRVSWTNAAALVDQAKWVASTLAGPNATLNDVFCSCVTAALAKQLAWHRLHVQTINSSWSTKESESNRELPSQLHFHLGIPVHLQGGIILPNQSIGNRIGAFVVRLPGESKDEESSVDRLRKVHHELNQVKRTPIAVIAHFMGRAAVNMLPSTWLPRLYQATNSGTIAVVTNVRGPSEALHIHGRTIDSVYGFVPLPPGIPVGVVVGSYQGRVGLTVTAQPWAVPDADQFLAWMLEEYLALVTEATARLNRGVEPR